jgi:hypothetical protein
MRPIKQLAKMQIAYRDQGKDPGKLPVEKGGESPPLDDAFLRYTTQNNPTQPNSSPQAYQHTNTHCRLTVQAHINSLPLLCFSLSTPDRSGTI